MTNPDTVDQALLKMTYVVLYPPGEQMLPNGNLISNQEIATDALVALVNGGGVTLPTGCGWAIHVVNNDTGEVTVIGNTE